MGTPLAGFNTPFPRATGEAFANLLGFSPNIFYKNPLELERYRNAFQGVKPPAAAPPGAPTPIATAPPQGVAENPRDALLKKYSADYDTRSKEAMKSLAGDKSGIGSAMLVSQLGPHPQALAIQSELQLIAAKEANRMGRENVELAAEYARKKQARDFTYDRFGKFLDSIPRAFSPMPFEATQNVAANIMNTLSPRNMPPIPGLQAAPLQMPSRQYYA